MVSGNKALILAIYDKDLYRFYFIIVSDIPYKLEQQTGKAWVQGELLLIYI